MNDERNRNRLLEDWLSGYIDYTDEQESPSLFHLWVGSSVIASTLGRKCWIDRGYYKLYPNLYVVLIGASARVRKTSAIRIGYDIFREAIPEATIVSQKTTPEALITAFVEDFGKKKKACEGVIVSDELGVFLGASTKSMDIMQLLTKWYDCPSYFDYRTQMRGKEVMQKVCCNMMAGTTPLWLKDSMPPHAVGGGFTSRIVFVYQARPEKLEPFPHISPEKLVLKKKLIADLKMIERIEGEYKLTEEAKEWFANWYTEVFKPEDMPHASLDGYYGRKHDTLLKVAMSVAASRSSKMEIGEAEMRIALRALNQNEKHLPQTLRLIQMTESGEETEKVFRAIKRRGSDGIDHTYLMRQVSYCMNAKKLGEVLEDLICAERIKQFTKGGKSFYKEI